MSTIQVLAGDLPEGTWQFTKVSNIYQLNLDLQKVTLNSNIAEIEVLDKQKFHQMADMSEWDFLTTSLDLVDDALADNDHESFCLAVELIDGRRFLGIADIDVYQELIFVTQEEKTMFYSTEKELEDFINQNGHLPRGIFKEEFSAEKLSKYLSSFLLEEESVLDTTVVRYKGINSFLIISDKRVICFTQDKNIDLDLDEIVQVIAAKNGIIFFSSEMNLRFYFVNNELGMKFANSISTTNLLVEYIEAIPKDKYESKLGRKIIIFLLIILIIIAIFVLKARL